MVSDITSYTQHGIYVIICWILVVFLSLCSVALTKSNEMVCEVSVGVQVAGRWSLAVLLFLLVSP
jgi:hypothetical protein